MRRSAFGVAVIVALVVSASWSQALAQTQVPAINYNFQGGGARPGAMAGAYIGLSNDASAAVFNPAGLTLQDRIFTEIDYGIQGQSVDNTLQASEDLGFLYENGSQQTRAHFTYLAFNGPATIKGQRFYMSALWTRLNYRDFQSEFNLTDFSDFAGDPTGFATPLAARFSDYVRGGPEQAALAAATQILEEKLSLGMALNIYLGSSYDSTQIDVDVEYDLGSNGTLQEREVNVNRENVDYSGLNFNFGTQYQFETVTLGATVKTPYKLKLQRDVRLAGTLYEITPDSLLERVQNSLLFKTESEIEMPLQLGFGVSFRPQENLTLSADYEWKNFSNSNILTQADSLDPRSEFVATDPMWKDVHQIRVGVEFRISPEWGQIPIRAGFRTEPQPYSHQVNVQDILNDPLGEPRSSENGDQVVGEVYTLGVGVDWRQIRVDLTWELGTNTVYQSGIYEDSFTKPQFIYEQKTRTQMLMLAFTGFF